PGAKGAMLSVVAAPGASSALVTAGGKPASSGSVRVFEGGVGRLGGTKDWALLIADKAGRFSVPGLPDRSELTWLASAQEHPPKRIVSTASRLPAQIVLPDGATVKGRLLDSGGRPLSGASVQVEAWASSEAPISFAVQAETDAQGRFAASTVPLGKAMLSVRKTGWAPLRQPVEVPHEGIDLGTLSLTRGDSLTVRTLDDAGEPVAGAEVRPDLGEPATTGPDGTALLPHLPEQVEIRLRATAKGHLPSQPRGVQLPAPGPLELRLPRAFLVKGRFAAADGAPLADAAVKMARGRNFDTAPLDPDGSFSLPLRPAQEYTLTFSSPQSASLEVPVAAGGPAEERDLGELRAPVAGEIMGRLVDGATGEPVPGARIWCPRPSAQGPLVAWMSRDLLEASSGPDGAFRLRGLPPGPTALRIEASGFARAQRGVDVPGEGSADLGDLPLSRGATLVVSTGPRSGPRSEGAVVFVDPGGEGLPFDRLMEPVRDGIARVEQVPAGASKVSVMKGSAVVCEKTVQVQAEAGETSVECSAEGIL
ncbi:MAG TPA: carboxypeptidase-like regulatory domain-containing protein, partial [Thermoanaerobaculia bacterium]